MEAINPKSFYYIISCSFPANLEHAVERFCSHISQFAFSHNMLHFIFSSRVASTCGNNSFILINQILTIDKSEVAELHKTTQEIKKNLIIICDKMLHGYEYLQYLYFLQLLWKLSFITFSLNAWESKSQLSIHDNSHRNVIRRVMFIQLGSKNNTQHSLENCATDPCRAVGNQFL